MSESPKQRKIAYLENPVIEATVKQLFRFATPEQALKRLEQIRESFEISSVQESEDGPLLKLWIKGFAITEEEGTAGYLGHFAIIGPRKVSEGHYILYAEKEEVPLAKHPQKRRPKQKHPNWGHPVLRSIQKKKTWPQLMQAQSELDKLHREFPETSIPGVNKLHIIVYSKGPEQKGNPTKKMVFEIKSTPKGEFEIIAKDNSARKKTPPKIQIPISPAMSGNPLPEGVHATHGRFTAMVELKKKKRPTSSGGNRPTTS